MSLMSFNDHFSLSAFTNFKLSSYEASVEKCKMTFYQQRNISLYTSRNIIRVAKHPNKYIPYDGMYPCTLTPFAKIIFPQLVTNNL